MEKAIVAWMRGMVCVLALGGLAACGNEEGASGSGTAPTGEQPSNPENPGTPEEPQEPNEPGVPSSPANAAPQIGGTPASQAVVGEAFNFVPSASDTDGDDLTFAVSSKPAWASFDAHTGRLWGTPSADDVGAHEEIQITVTDGDTVRALPQFAINVVQNANGSAALAWMPPTENTDGTSLTNLKGYKIHYGTESGSYDMTITINDAGTTSYVIENLAAGTYYFAISSVAGNGTESDLSAEASKTI